MKLTAFIVIVCFVGCCCLLAIKFFPIDMSFANKEPAKPAVKAEIAPKTLTRNDAHVGGAEPAIPKSVVVIESTQTKLVRLRSLLKDPDDQVRVKGINGLAKIGAEAIDAADDLLSLYQSDQAPSVRAAAAQVLSKLNYANVLRILLHDADDQIRVGAAKRLAEADVDGRSALPDLIDILAKDKVPEARIAAVNALTMITYHNDSKSPDKTVIAALIKALQHDEDTVVRWAACDSFVMIGRGRSASAAAPALLEAMTDKDDEHLRQIGRRSFSSVVGPDCQQLVPVLLEMYKTGIEEAASEGTVLIALGRIGDQKEIIVPLLIDVVKDKKPKHLQSAQQPERWAIWDQRRKQPFRI